MLLQCLIRVFLYFFSYFVARVDVDAALSRFLRALVEKKVSLFEGGL